MITSIGNDIVGGVLGAAGAAVGTALNLFGGARAARRKRKILDEQERKNESWFNQDYYSSPLERAAWQASVAGMNEAHAKRMASARGSAAVGGASAGSVLAEKVSANQGAGQAMRDVASQGEALAQNAKSRYMARDAEIANQRYNAEEAYAQQMANAATQASKLGAGFSGGKSTT